MRLLSHAASFLGADGEERQAERILNYAIVTGHLPPLQGRAQQHLHVPASPVAGVSHTQFINAAVRHERRVQRELADEARGQRLEAVRREAAASAQRDRHLRSIARLEQTNGHREYLFASGVNSSVTYFGAR